MRTSCIDLTPDAEAKLAELSELTSLPPSALLSAAVERMHRSQVGLPDGDPDGPHIDTGPFRKELSFQPAEVVLRQVDATNFDLEESFRFIGDDGRARWTVPQKDVTDLASVPSPCSSW